MRIAWEQRAGAHRHVSAVASASRRLETLRKGTDSIHQLGIARLASQMSSVGSMAAEDRVVGRLLRDDAAAATRRAERSLPPLRGGGVFPAGVRKHTQVVRAFRRFSLSFKNYLNRKFIP